jgi:hypothetical protein
MLAKNILAVLTFVVAASATPVVDLGKRNAPSRSCGSNQELECCESITFGIGVNCVSGKANPYVYKISLFEDMLT